MVERRTDDRHTCPRWPTHERIQRDCVDVAHCPECRKKHKVYCYRYRGTLLPVRPDKAGSDPSESQRDLFTRNASLVGGASWAFAFFSGNWSLNLGFLVKGVKLACHRHKHRYTVSLHNFELTQGLMHTALSFTVTSDEIGRHICRYVLASHLHNPSAAPTLSPQLSTAAASLSRAAHGCTV